MIQLHDNILSILLSTFLNTINDSFTYVLSSILVALAKDLNEIYSRKTEQNNLISSMPLVLQ